MPLRPHALAMVPFEGEVAYSSYGHECLPLAKGCLDLVGFGHSEVAAASGEEPRAHAWQTKGGDFSVSAVPGWAAVPVVMVPCGQAPNQLEKMELGGCRQLN